MVRQLESPVSDARALACLRDESLAALGVDSPFGWPRRFRDFVRGWSASAGGSAPPPASDFSWRRTDRVVHAEVGKLPLSVSTDRIALCTRSWLEVVHASGAQERVDVGQAKRPSRPILEAYPAANLRVFAKAWPRELSRAGEFKRSRAGRRATLLALRRLLSLEVTERQLDQLCGEADEDSDVADALLAAITAAIACDVVEGWRLRAPTAEEAADALDEGWIFFPLRT